MHVSMVAHAAVSLDLELVSVGENLLVPRGLLGFLAHRDSYYKVKMEKKGFQGMSA